MDAKSAASMAITNGLSILGESSGSATAYFVKRSARLELEDFVEHPNELSNALRQIFGYGSALLLSAIAKEAEDTGRTLTQGERKKLEAFLAAIRENIKSIETGIM